MDSKLMAVLSMVILLAMIPVGCSPGSNQDTIDVPIKIMTEKEVIGVAFELLYDPAVLEATTVDKSTLALGSRAAYTLVEPGRLYVQVTDAPNIDRNGTLVVAHFRLLDGTGSSTFTIDFKVAEDRNTNEQLPFEVSDGRFDSADMSVKSPVITIG